MYSKSPSRNNRSKGVKVKHILQICLLIAVCFWLIYQVKRSHEKKKEFDEKDAKLASILQRDSEIPRLNRRDIPRVIETSTDDKITAEDDEETEVEQTESRHEDDEQEIEEIRTDDRDEDEDAAKGGEDDEIDKVGEGKTEEENHEDEFVDTEKEDGDDGEKDDNEESEAVLENRDHEGNTQQEREEHYKADDASSEVAHDAINTVSYSENATLNHTDRTSELVTNGKDNVSLPLPGKPIEATNSSDSRVLATEQHKDNSTVLTESSDHVTNVTKLEPVQSNNITLAQNATSEENHMNDSNSNLTLSLVSHGNTSELASDENQSVINSTTLGSSPEVKSSFVATNGTTTTTTTETKVDDVNLGESGSDTVVGNVTDEENERSVTEMGNDSVDDFASSMTQEENEARSDPGTLPDIKLGVENAEDEAE